MVCRLLFYGEGQMFGVAGKVIGGLKHAYDVKIQ